MSKRRSITRQIMLTICILIAGTILGCWILNSTLLENYYIMKKKATMVENFAIISEAGGNGTLESSEFDVTFETIAANDNIKMVIVNEEFVVVRTSVSDMSTISDELRDMVFGTVQGELIESSEQYTLVRKEDSRLGGEYLVLLGKLENDDFILMKTPLESISESAELANQFLLIVGLCAVAVSCLVGGFQARRITKPILQLTEISEKMVNLDFNAKYVPAAPRWGKRRPDSTSRRQTGTAKSVQYGKQQPQAAVSGNEIDQLGDHMNRLSENLERTISELKTANLELQRDIEQKTKIDEMRKEFLSNVSHELKTPLALIQGYAEGLQECINDDEESRDFYCEVIIDEADKMNRMVKKLLTLNQLEFGNDQVVMARFDITELICGVANSTRILMEQKEITLQLDNLEETYVWGDEFKVEEVITNYLSNAINHCEGEHKIRIFYTRCEEKLRVSVFNTGKQIPEEDLDMIWEKFYKVDKAHTREYGGSGIGLSIVKAIMDSFGQECGVINHEDGVEFWMELALK